MIRWIACWISAGESLDGWLLENFWSLEHSLEWSLVMVETLTPVVEAIEWAEWPVSSFVRIVCFWVGERDFMINFERLDTIEDNNIIKLDSSELDFLIDFRTKLAQHCWIESGREVSLFWFTYYPVIEICHRSGSPSGKTFPTLTTTLNPHPSTLSKETMFPTTFCCVILHTHWWLLLGRKTKSKSPMSGGSLTSWGGTLILFSVQGKAMDCECCYYSIICCGGLICCSSLNWLFKIIVTIESEDKKEYHYTPQSNFCISIDNLIYLLVEVQSDNDQYDWYQMLLQAACVAWLGCLFYIAPFIILALYIKNSGRVKWYFVFQCDGTDPIVCTFESKRSCILSPVLPGFLCWEHPRLEATIPVV